MPPLAISLSTRVRRRCCSSKLQSRRHGIHPAARLGRTAWEDGSRMVKTTPLTTNHWQRAERRSAPSCHDWIGYVKLCVVCSPPCARASTTSPSMTAVWWSLRA
ncbi:hypothetical protein C8T65DRAFT_659928 [Cerioporus squamosus]|nr:hypothetical protein C8T65DRAFT_659928 [Cerioporus squamosus]